MNGPGLEDGIGMQWMPGESVGPFKFGAPIAPLVEAGLLLLESRERIGTDELVVYRTVSEDASVVASSAGQVESVSCNAVLSYGGINLIGLTLDNLMHALGHPAVEWDEDLETHEGTFRIYEIISFGAQVWLLDGVVEEICAVSFDD